MIFIKINLRLFLAIKHKYAVRYKHKLFQIVFMVIIRPIFNFVFYKYHLLFIKICTMKSGINPAFSHHMNSTIVFDARHPTDKQAQRLLSAVDKLS